MHIENSEQIAADFQQRRATAYASAELSWRQRDAFSSNQQEMLESKEREEQWERQQSQEPSSDTMSHD